jgi:3-oxoacyl-[acyl-carrier-protein] synthase II
LDRSLKRRVVITGLGAVTPLATGVEESWLKLCQGKSGVARITKFDPSNFNVQIAAELKDFHPEDFLDRKKIRRTDPFIQYALIAARMAIDDAGLTINANNASSIGVVLGSCAGGMTMYGKNLFALRSNCIGDAFRHIQYSEADAMITGGSDAYVLPIAVAGFDKMRTLSRRNNEPEKASRPFEKNRDGFVIGEGAGVVILEEMKSAVRRGAKIYAELIGYGSNIDSFHITEPNWENQARCLKLAMSDAAISANDVDYINAHGTATILNDLSETKAIKAALGEQSKKVPVSSNKSMFGHLLGAAGSVEAIFTVLTIRDGIIPPTINYETPDPECDLDYVPNMGRKAEVNIALSNSFGFGGVNAGLVFRKFAES